tara:strand:+ start:140 stop:574 length:435 start_codon:yes stop_codon:yes gene_type:complete
MSKKIIDEKDLNKLNPDQKEEFISVNFSLNFTDKNTPNLEDQLLNNLNGLNPDKHIYSDLKIDNGFYWIGKRLYFSIWAYKRMKDIDAPNETHINYEDAKNLFRNNLVNATIEVKTHSPIFPVVKGYLEKDLDTYYANREHYLV